jgi:Uma2 family endonuclease
MPIAADFEVSMTLDEFETLADDPNIDRELLNGRLVERPMTWRNRWHSEVEVNVAAVLKEWVRTTTPRAGKVYCGEVGCRLPSVNSLVGIDVAFFSAETVAAQPENRAVLVGPPVLAVEILSAREAVEDLYEKVSLYLKAGVNLVWLVDPRFRTVTVHRSDAKPKMFIEGDVLSGEPFLPRFEVPVLSLFE